MEHRLLHLRNVKQKNIQADRPRQS
jgi:hypothetical protein